MRDTTAQTLQGFVWDHAETGTMVCTDEATACSGQAPNYGHDEVKHGVGENVRGQAHTNGIEPFWSMLKRGYVGTYHKISEKHLDRCVKQCAGRHNVRERDTIEQMGAAVVGTVGNHLMYQDTIADNGLHSGARS